MTDDRAEEARAASRSKIGRRPPASGDGAAAIERVSDADLVYLAMDRATAPNQTGAVLVLDSPSPLDLRGVTTLLGNRVAAIPRLRQRLQRVPFGCGRPIWVDDPTFDIATHVRAARCLPPGNEQSLLDLAAEVVSTSLPPSRPLWAATLVTGLAEDRVGLVIVLHHVVADGIGGLAALVRLADRAGPADDEGPTAAFSFPRPVPSRRAIARDANRQRRSALRRAPTIWRDLRASVRATAGFAVLPAARCSLLQPTGRQIRLAAVHADYALIRAAAHGLGGTVNDAVVATIAGALQRLLASRGEALDTVNVVVPVSARAAASSARLGNAVTPLLLQVPTTGGLTQRIQVIRAAVSRRKAVSTGPAPLATLGPLFRIAARTGAYECYLRRQRRMHTLISHVRGPEHPLTFGGVAVCRVIPVAVGESGNITVAFEVLSYAGTLTITIMVDAATVTDQPVLTEALTAELSLLSRPGERQ